MRKNIVLSMQAAEVAELDKLASELQLSRSATVRLLVTLYYDHGWQGNDRRKKTREDGQGLTVKTATFGRKVE